MNTQRRSPAGGQHSRRRSPSGFAGSQTRSNSSGPRKTGGSRFTSKKRGSKKDFIQEHLFINKAVQKEVENFVPTHTFADFELPPLLTRNLAEKGFIKPSPIQDQAIPVGFKGKDIIGIASTGTGKTAAFLIPLITKLVADREHKVMILAPTRELAQQIEKEFQTLTKGMNFYSVSCVGGAPINNQIRELGRGVHVVIGTPGRVNDLITRKKLDMALFESIVLDEADRMLDMGFVDDMRYILGLMPKHRQSFFFSATISPEIKRLCSEFLNDPVTISVKNRDTSGSVEQDVVRVKDRSKKIDVLQEILNRPECSKVLIFREMKRSVDELADELKSRGFKALALHGDMRNRERERAVMALAQGHAHIVIATDVAARGIDIPDITHVINFDIPSTYDTYVHRIGRTGRGSRMGVALTFV